MEAREINWKHACIYGLSSNCCSKMYSCTMFCTTERNINNPTDVLQKIAPVNEQKIKGKLLV
jgi:hypothetical protein